MSQQRANDRQVVRAVHLAVGDIICSAHDNNMLIDSISLTGHGNILVQSNCDSGMITMTFDRLNTVAIVRQS